MVFILEIQLISDQIVLERDQHYAEQHYCISFFLVDMGIQEKELTSLEYCLSPFVLLSQLPG